MRGAEFGRPGRQRDCAKNQQVELANSLNLTVDNIGEKVDLTNRKPSFQATKNPSALAGATGTMIEKKASQLYRNPTPKSRFNAMSLYAKARHKRTVKALGYVLTLGTAQAWEGFVTILLARLTKGERQALAYAALVTLDDDTAYRTASAALYGVWDGEELTQ